MTLLIDTKPTLEWFIWGNETWMCHDDYVIKWHNIKRKFILLDERKVNVIIECDTIDQAKALAQADYERRTAERFRPITLPELMNARQGDGSVHYCTGWNDVLDAIAKERGEV